MAKELPTAEEAREQAFQSALNRLDKYLNQAIQDGQTEREFDLAEWNGDQILIDHIDEVVQHFRDKGYHVDYTRADDTSLAPAPQKGNFLKRLFAPKYTEKRSRGYSILVTW